MKRKRKEERRRQAGGGERRGSGLEIATKLPGSGGTPAPDTAISTEGKGVIGTTGEGDDLLALEGFDELVGRR